MTTRQTLPELLARISEDLTEARLNAASRTVREERARADRYRDEASAYREILEDVVESLELLAPPEQVADRPEVIPVAELAEVLGCDADTASVRQQAGFLQQMHRAAGTEPDATTQELVDRVKALVVFAQAAGFIEHSGLQVPALPPKTRVIFRRRDGYQTVAEAKDLRWHPTPQESASHMHDLSEWKLVLGGPA